MGPEGFLDGLQFRGDGTGQLEDGFLARWGALLRQVSGLRSPFPFDLPFIRLALIEEDREQGGLAGSVWADQPELLPAHQSQGNLPKQNLRAESLADVG